jgi:hypothetical protein
MPSTRAVSAVTGPEEPSSSPPPRTRLPAIRRTAMIAAPPRAMARVRLEMPPPVVGVRPGVFVGFDPGVFAVFDEEAMYGVCLPGPDDRVVAA